jgi:hypothetical protein
MHSSLSATPTNHRALLMGAMLSPPPAPAIFEIYRRTAANGLADILAAHFPVTRRMIGDDSFAAIAHSYTIQFPPRSPALVDYGTSLPTFIRSRGRAPSIEYLADIAELESARMRAYHAADAVPVTLGAFSRGLTIDLHPSASLVSSRFPVVSIWE